MIHEKALRLLRTKPIVPRFGVLCIVFLAAGFLGPFSPGRAADAQSPIPEIQDTRLHDFAMTKMVDGRLAIAYNPVVCERMGPLLCGFYRMHERGHIALGHPPLSGATGKREEDEIQADCWAAQRASRAEVRAAYDYFLAGGGSTTANGPGAFRALTLRRCGQF